MTGGSFRLLLFMLEREIAMVAPGQAKMRIASAANAATIMSRRSAAHALVVRS
jgi:hypothetical protein